MYFIEDVDLLSLAHEPPTSDPDLKAVYDLVAKGRRNGGTLDRPDMVALRKLQLRLGLLKEDLYTIESRLPAEAKK